MGEKIILLCPSLFSVKAEVKAKVSYTPTGNGTTKWSYDFSVGHTAA
jgi:hypothetical protein